jgi:UDP-glucose 4-epimerase
VRIVVVGASGNVGTSLLSKLAGDPSVTSILAIARRKPAISFAKAEWVSADIAVDDLTPHFRSAAAVVHVAWLLQPERDRDLLDRVNVHGSTRVFEAAAQAQVPALLYASSVGAYSPAEKGRLVDESWPTQGIGTSLYSRQKAAVEDVLDSFEQAHPDMRIVRIRPSLIFKREAASEQQRLFLGRLFPVSLLRPGRLPILPFHPRLRFQAVHSLDVGDAFHRAAVRDVRGAFNIAADPVVDGPLLGQVLEARTLTLPPRLMRAAVAAAFALRLAPASPGWFDMALMAPLMNTARARAELDWSPSYAADAVMREIFVALSEQAGIEHVPPLQPEGSHAH